MSEPQPERPDLASRARCGGTRDLLRLLKSDLNAQRHRAGRAAPFVYPQIAATAGYRVARWLRLRGHPRAAAAAAAVVQLLTGADISPEAAIGPGFCIVHTGAVVIGPRVVVGRGLTVFGGVTLGALLFESRGGRPSGFPCIGDDVVIYAKASVLGPITIGDRAVVGAHALVLKDVPPRHFAVGVPARATP